MSREALPRALPAHTVVETRERGWHLFKNGDLLNAAEDAAFDGLETRSRGSKSGALATGPPKAQSRCRRCGSNCTRQLYRSRNTDPLTKRSTVVGQFSKSVRRDRK